MKRRLEILRVLNNLLLVYIVVGVFLLGLKVPAGPALYVGNVGLLFFVMASEVIQALLSNLILFLSAHFAAILSSAAASYYLSRAFSNTPTGFNNQLMLIMRVFVMVIITIIAIYTRLDSKPRFYPAMPEAFLFPVSYIFCKIIRCPEAEVLVLIGEVIWAVLCIVFYNAWQTSSAMVAFKKRDYVPYDMIKKINGQMLGISVVVSLVVMFVVSLFDYGEQVLNAVQNFFLGILRWIFSFFHFEAQQEFETVARDAGGGSMSDLLPKDYKDDTIWHTLWQILFWVVATVVTIFVLILFVKLIMSFYKLFNSSHNGLRDRLSKDKVEFLNPFNEEKSALSADRENYRLGPFKRLTTEGRIRALFVKYIRNGKNYALVDETRTSKELEEISCGESESKAYMLYNKARYSHEDITSEDVKQMKKIISGGSH